MAGEMENLHISKQNQNVQYQNKPNHTAIALNIQYGTCITV